MATFRIHSDPLSTHGSPFGLTSMEDGSPEHDSRQPGAGLLGIRRKAARALRTASLDLLPARCHACRVPLAPSAQTASELLCAGCHHDLPWNTPCCLHCATPLAAPGVCGHCAQHPPPFVLTLAPLRLESPVQQWIHRLKYHADFAAAAQLGRLIAVALQSAGHARPDVLIPVPLHRERLLRRGYNQALELARPVAAATGIALWAQGAQRVRATPDQIGQSLVERRRNVRGAFVILRPLRGLRVALIDDVMTTGATLAELARACRAAGAGEVQVWAAARTP